MGRTRVASAAIEFTAEDAKFLASLKNIQRENKTLGGSFQQLGRDAQSVFGAGLEQKANQAVTAIRAVGGATKLTDDEAKKHLHTLDQWIAKSKALGKEVPDSILSTRSALANVNAEAGKSPGLFQSIGGGALKMAGALGLAFSAQAAIGFAKSVIDSASQVDDLSKKIGVSREAIQRWSYAAQQSGQSIETVDKAVTKMNQNLAEGDKGTISALKRVGLSFDEIRKMRPEDAFNAIVAAVGKIEDPMTQADVALRLFGKTGVELLPAIQEGFAETAASARVMSDETIKRLDAAGDAWVKLTNIATIYTGEFIGGVMELAEDWIATIERMTSSWKKFAQTVQILAAGSLTGMSGLTDAMKLITQLDAAESGKGGTKKDPKTEDEDRKRRIAGIIAEAKAEAGREAAEKKGLQAKQERLEIDKKLAAAEIPLTEGERARIEQLLKRGLSEGEITKKLGASEIAVKNYVDVLKREADWLKKVNELAREQIPLLKATADNLKNLPVNVFNPSSPTFAQKIPLDTLANEVLPDDLIAALDREMGNINFALDDGAVKTHAFIASWDKLPHVSGEVQKLSDKIERLFKDVGLQAAGDLASAMADNLRSGDWSQFENQLSGVISNALGSAAARAVDLWVPGLGSALQPLFTALGEKLMGWLGLGTRGRDLVKDFAASFGGFDGLHRELNKLGAEGEKLWINLTQGVGRNNPEEARKAIEAINRALGNSPESLASAAGYQTRDELQELADKARKVYEYVRDSGKYSAEQIADAFEKSKDAQIAAMSDVQRAAYNTNKKIVDDLTKQLDTLDSEYNSIFESWAAEDAAPEFDEAGNRIFGVVEAQQRARLDAIAEERKAIQEQLDAANEAMRLSMEDVADSVRELVQVLKGELGGALDSLDGRHIRIKVSYDADDLPTPGSQAPGAATGGFVTDTGITQYRGFGGSIKGLFRPRGTDTVPAMLTPGEFVMNTRAVDLIGADVLAGLNAGRLGAMPVARNAGASTGAPHISLSVDARGARIDSPQRVDQLATTIVQKIRGNLNGIGTDLFLHGQPVGSF